MSLMVRISPLCNHGAKPGAAFATCWVQTFEPRINDTLSGV